MNNKNKNKLKQTKTWKQDTHIVEESTFKILLIGLEIFFASRYLTLKTAMARKQYKTPRTNCFIKPLSLSLLFLYLCEYVCVCVYKLENNHNHLNKEKSGSNLSKPTSKANCLLRNMNRNQNIEKVEIN